MPLAGRLGNRQRGAVLKILAGVGSGQLLMLAGSPLILRIYGPTDFGIFTLLNSIAVPGVVVLTGRFDVAIPLPESESFAFSVFWLGVALASAVAVIAAGALGAASAIWGLTPFHLQPEVWFWLLPCMAWSAACFQLLNSLAVRQERFGLIAKRSALQAFVTVGAQVLLGLQWGSAVGLVTGFFLGQLATSALMLRGAGLTSASAGRAIAIRRLLTAGRRYSRFPKHLMPAGLLNALALQAPVPLITLWFTIASAGQFGLTQRIVALPISLLGQAVANVYIGQAAKEVRQGRVDEALRLFESTSRRLAVVALILVVATLALAHMVVPLVFGRAWAPAGEMTQAMAVALGAQVVASPLSQTLILLERTRAQLWFDAIRLSALVMAISVCALGNAGPIGAVWCYSVVSAASYGGIWWYSRRALWGAKLSNVQGVRS